MRNHHIVITRPDAARLRELLARRSRAERDQEHLHELAEELDRASVADADEVPGDVVTIHARFHVLDLASGARHDLQLVLPGDSDAGAGRISVLAPMGTALLGYRAGDEVECDLPGGTRRLRIERVHRALEHPQMAASAAYGAAGA
jgi:regulator of nucleoside diphosphate kinase